ncbi:N-acetylmuramic acid-6-phosphate etherase [Leifsonia xyli subsp. cynodontis DSM 46306]|jgi:N-acetylmuramic acid 6-phosphate etherase|uniref:N-acetylmuramic acid 6-phosphate etherase n=1 Tax=Leifsonia xyli subsp. cynodontis DSM 46306 TaxID=1389489 RepID=U3P640_LEIXC|nr:N-acetylmuramic acid 6-phosphate etherase [Leifsonia xyli]AGW40909.1 N-acetylmuramic acid-6-phosphate etherase [Leifsonia xyli subsp. cynodontis DSM 46306]
MTIPAPTASHPLPPTELRSPDSTGLDELSALERLRLLNAHDRRAMEAVAEALPRVAELVDQAAPRVRRGGVVHYFGAGTPGRLAVLDAAELLPTFHLEPGVVTAHIAGGERALTVAVEDSEDSVADGERDADLLGPDDVAIGVTASGSTPYVGGALRRARERGAFTALITSNPDAALAGLADILIAVETGPEVLTGSTRLGAGTAQKTILSGFSTALMIALGRTYSNLMVSVVATNAKLRDRTLRILREAGAPEGEAEALLAAAGGDLKAAIVALLTGADADRASAALAAASGSVRDAVAALHD